MSHFPRIWHRLSPVSISSFNQSPNQTTPLPRTWSLPRASPYIYLPSRPTSTSPLPSPSSPSTRRRSKGRTPRKQISTLDPNRLQPSDFIDLSTHSTVGIWTVPRGSYEAPKIALRYGMGDRNSKLPFPSGARGFLYYARDPGLAEGGQVRFRIVATPEGAFEEGQDLLLRNGMPWHIPPGLLPRAPNVGLARLLLRDELVTREQVAAWESYPQKLRHSPVVTRFGQPFTPSLSTSMLVIWVRTSTHDRVCHLRLWLSLARHSFTRGVGTVCLEPSSLPEHAGKRIVVIRVLELLEPVESRAGLPFTPTVPVVGELLRHPRSGRTVEFDLDRPSIITSTLRSFWDDYEKCKPGA
ncbi:hypothetical protein BC834DRAFT_181335 [Gloeopeniophorella convolvens]|nr:hypothetical protein BC834DRAFT_181335 [Gloeopeniophorella convolvens]